MTLPGVVTTTESTKTGRKSLIRVFGTQQSLNGEDPVELYCGDEVQECEADGGTYHAVSGPPNYEEDCECVVECCLIDNEESYLLRRHTLDRIKLTVGSMEFMTLLPIRCPR